MRKLVVGLATVAVVALGAGSAWAKGPVAPVPGRLVVNGPGLDAPIVLRGDVYWFEYGVGGTADPSTELTTLLAGLGLLQAGPEVGWYELPPDPTTLGPAYAVKEWLDVDGEGGANASPVRATMYPFAPDRPMVFLPGMPTLATAKGGLWWSAPPFIRTLLAGLGFPRRSRPRAWSLPGWLPAGSPSRRP
jgi:hypothetical protein